MFVDAPLLFVTAIAPADELAILAALSFWHVVDNVFYAAIANYVLGQRFWTMRKKVHALSTRMSFGVSEWGEEQKRSNYRQPRCDRLENLPTKIQTAWRICEQHTINLSPPDVVNPK